MRLRAIIDGPARGARRLARMVFRRNPLRLFGMPRSSYDYLSDVGDGTGSSTVMAPLLWVMRTFPEAPPVMWRSLDDGLEEMVRDHELLRLLRRPNAHYSRPILWMATLADYLPDGNAYWYKIRDAGGKPTELWWMPRGMIEPRGSETDYLTHYEYRIGGKTFALRPDDVVHFRFGLDPDNTLKGMSPLKSVLREVFTDDEAANFTASLLRNMGVPGLVVSPEIGTVISPEDGDYTKSFLKAKFSGDNRGEALVMSGPTKVAQFGFSPEQLLLKELRRIPEERVSAVTGVPAVVAGLGAGLDRSTFTNYAEAREAAYEQAIIPTQTGMAEDLWFQLLPDFVPEEDIWRWRMGFDLSLVRVLQEDRFNLSKRLDLGVRGGWVRVSEGRRAAGLPVDDGDEIYLRQMTVVQVPVDGSEPVRLTPPRTTQLGASDNGRASYEEVNR